MICDIDIASFIAGAACGTVLVNLITCLIIMRAKI